MEPPRCLLVSPSQPGWITKEQLLGMSACSTSDACARERFFSNFFLPRDARHYESNSFIALCRISKYLSSIFSVRKIPPFLNLFPVYRETLIENTRSVDSCSLPARSHKTHYFYAILCEVYLGRTLILHRNLEFHAVICSARTSRVTMIGGILTNGRSRLCYHYL